eukprot:GFUD01026810.1.p1 GENE.GFUD01026810.1~~GFUD01026810.1.p1  ORF type:complete len:329 (+),score=74.18 GFUD01026810.1:25-1011(+)
MATFTELSDDEKETVNKSYGELCTFKDLVNTDPRTVTLSRSHTRNIQRVMTMQIRPSDVWLVTPPKCGTTWLQDMTWLIRNEADLEGVKTFLFQRSPFLDFPMVGDMKQELVEKSFDDLEMMPSPRLIKTHLPFELLPPDLLNVCKVIFCCRNIKDASVSFYHHERLFKGHHLLIDTFESYARTIIRPALYIFGGYFEMLESGWKRKKDPNMLFLWYEDMKKDQKKVIKDIMGHIAVDLTEEQVNAIDEHMKFDNYKKTCTLNTGFKDFLFEGRGQFVRKGVVGDHVNYFSEELSLEWDDWICTKLDQIGVKDEIIRQFFNVSKKSNN